MKIKEVRTKYHLTQSQVVSLTGVPLRTLQSWETGERKCPEYVERFITEAIEQHCSVKEYLIVWEDENTDFYEDYIQALTPEQGMEIMGIPKEMVKDVYVNVKILCY